MVAGGALGAIGLILIALQFPWAWQIAIYGVFGFGFYLLHGCIQVHVTELSPTARGAAASLHSCSFYMGQAVGPVVYGFGFAHGGPEPTMFIWSRGRDGSGFGLRAPVAAPHRSMTPGSAATRACVAALCSGGQNPHD